MTACFQNIYVALRDQTTPPQDEFDEFIHHIDQEITSKYRGYTGSGLTDELQEDLFQQALAEIGRGVSNDSFRPEMNTFKNWVDGLIRNTIRKHITYQKKRQAILSLNQLVEDGVQWQDDTMLTPEASLLRRYDISVVRRGMRTLQKTNLKYYQVLYYRAFQDLTTAETAQRLSTTAEDVSRTLNRAKDKLRQIIEVLEKTASRPKTKRK